MYKVNACVFLDYVLFFNPLLVRFKYQPKSFIQYIEKKNSQDLISRVALKGFVDSYASSHHLMYLVFIYKFLNLKGICNYLFQLVIINIC